MVELWAGLECSITRIGQHFRDQSMETGHTDRPDDLERIAELGIKTLRYPILWERISPNHPDDSCFRATDERIRQARKLGFTLIAGLCHHGSGPAYTNLLDPEWPRLLAAHAARVARRYPHIEYFTPVNEPLTTARFSALYGHWYPHKASTADFLKALVHQCKATVLSMQLIRAVRPDAKLVQTEDIGKTFAGPMLAYQAEYENTRRWLSLDLLAGRVDRGHPLWRHLMENGIDQSDLDFFLEAAEPPDIIGVNHYLTSERYLDEQINAHAAHHHGGNGFHQYADVEAVRVPGLALEVGPAARLAEVWQRYKLPLAITEVHHGCTRDEQMRWLAQVWQAATKLKAEGADIRAVALWALFGTMDWNSLLTRREGAYEPGVFDVRAKKPRATAIAQMARQLATNARLDHPVLDRARWWQRPTHHYGHLRHEASECGTASKPRCVLIIGSGALPEAFARVCAWRGLDFVADAAPVPQLIASVKPWAVIDATYQRRKGLASQSSHAMVEACARAHLPLMIFSSETVFDGQKPDAYGEHDKQGPICHIGRGEVARKRATRQIHPRPLIIRTSALFSPWKQSGFIQELRQALRQVGSFTASNEKISPTYIPDLVHESLNLLIDGAEGTWHLVNAGQMSWFDLAGRAAEHLGAGRAFSLTKRNQTINRPLQSERGGCLPDFEHAWDRWRRELEAA